MTGLLDWLKSLYTVGVQYICWLGLATLVFSHSLEKRKMACLKGSAATAGFLLLGMLASSTAVDGALPGCVVFCAAAGEYAGHYELLPD